MRLGISGAAYACFTGFPNPLIGPRLPWRRRSVNRKCRGGGLRSRCLCMLHWDSCGHGVLRTLSLDCGCSCRIEKSFEKGHHIRVILHQFNSMAHDPVTLVDGIHGVLRVPIPIIVFSLLGPRQLEQLADPCGHSRNFLFFFSCATFSKALFRSVRAWLKQLAEFRKKHGQPFLVFLSLCRAPR